MQLYFNYLKKTWFFWVVCLLATLILFGRLSYNNLVSALEVYGNERVAENCLNSQLHNYLRSYGGDEYKDAIAEIGIDNITINDYVQMESNIINSPEYKMDWLEPEDYANSIWTRTRLGGVEANAVSNYIMGAMVDVGIYIPFYILVVFCIYTFIAFIYRRRLSVSDKDDSFFDWWQGERFVLINGFIVLLIAFIVCNWICVSRFLQSVVDVNAKIYYMVENAYQTVGPIKHWEVSDLYSTITKDEMRTLLPMLLCSLLAIVLQYFAIFLGGMLTKVRAVGYVGIILMHFVIGFLNIHIIIIEGAVGGTYIFDVIDKAILLCAITLLLILNLLKREQDESSFIFCNKKIGNIMLYLIICRVVFEFVNYVLYIDDRFSGIRASEAEENYFKWIVAMILGLIIKPGITFIIKHIPLNSMLRVRRSR